MKTEPNLKAYITTSSADFNRQALWLFLENSKRRLFADDATPMMMLNGIMQNMDVFREDVFGFAAGFENMTQQETLSLDQRLLIARAAKNYLSDATKPSRGAGAYLKDYLRYFITLEERIMAEIEQTRMSAGGIVGVLTSIMQAQMAKLPDEIAALTTPQKVKVIASLCKLLPEYNKLGNPPQTPTLS